MDRERIRMYEDKCTQDFAPACTSKCPVHVDVKSMLHLAGKGDFDGAAKVFAKSVIFPNIISRICDHPCEVHCKREEVGGSILISKLERACMDYSDFKRKLAKPFKKIDMKVAIVGAGLDGLAAAMFLYEKGYDVTVFDESEQIGGKEILHPSLDQVLIEEDFRVFESTNISFELGNTINIDNLKKVFDGLYDTKDETFIGENAYEKGSIIQLLCNGRTAAITLDRQMKKVSETEGRNSEGPYETKLFVETKYFDDIPHIDIGGKGSQERINRSLSQEEAIEEAKRCIQCECLECVKECKFLQKYKSYPKRYVREIANNVNMTMGMRQTKFMVNECTFCGLCGEICPNKLNMGDVCREAKVELVDNYHMPPAIHDFPINDMLFSNSPFFSLLKNPPGENTSKYLFYPGCQLSALEPNHVVKAYGYLQEKLDNQVGIFLGCCGGPAEWSGRVPLFDQTMDGIKSMWEEAGRPIMITACATCTMMFKNNIEGMEIKSLWQVYNEHGIEGKGRASLGQIAIHDACTARFDSDIQENVRELAEKKGYQIAELEFSKGMTKCCSYGGLVSFTNRALSSEMVKDRIEESDKDYVVYCAMCKERFTREGKNSWHILDLIYGDMEEKNGEERSTITFSQRHENRIKLKGKLLDEFWGEEMSSEIQDYERILIKFAEGVEEMADNRLILVSDIQKVILEAEETGETVYNPKNGHITAKLQPGVITYWVEYAKEEDHYVIHKTYSHRLEINKKLEGNEHRKYKL